MPPTPQHYYSPWQITVGTLIGGPLAGGYLAAHDHTLLGEPGKGRVTLAVSCVVIVLLLYLGSVLPERSPTSILPFAVALGYRYYASFAFDAVLSRKSAEGWVQQSWWRAVGLSFAFLAAMVAIIALAVITLAPA